jgi:hypothetical protein
MGKNPKLHFLASLFASKATRFLLRASQSIERKNRPQIFIQAGFWPPKLLFSYSKSAVYRGPSPSMGEQYGSLP